MAKQAKIGWLFSLAKKDSKDSNWSHVECFHDRLKGKKDPIIIESPVWGRKKDMEFYPQPGDGFGLYHSTSAEFPSGDLFKRKARISVIGELLYIETDGQKINWFKISVSRADLEALAKHPIIRDKDTSHIFERCGIVPGFPASLYKADREAWQEILHLLNQRKRGVT
jgi:hypothetical protein